MIIAWTVIFFCILVVFVGSMVLIIEMYEKQENERLDEEEVIEHLRPEDISWLRSVEFKDDDANNQ